ncbi:MAG TPA: NAD(P)-binding domain-containing protein [Steroidobacteraceae bacterium]|jgi:thioredoxin reductase/NAD-dependent dihydropyrimidine dehydrogenase PreA subunit|nr:NAD(P)-binding domain-containing protein [Steroidobacteraceae bacterium]
MSNPSLYLVYIVPLLAIWAIYWLKRQRRQSANVATLTQSREAGLIEPASLHPVIDATRCLGCGACVSACPEQPEHQVLGLIDGKAQLIGPTDCIGHGACRSACPTDAITLVFGTETRGVTIPLLSPQFESSVPGVFIAGELGGMGLIRNALTQGRQAVEAIHARRPRGRDALDLVIVGAGPAGFAAALTAKSLGLRYCVLEQEALGGCVFQYPRGKLVMTSPAELPLVGRIRFGHTSKEQLLAFWQDVEKRHALVCRYRERVIAVESLADGGFQLRTPTAQYRAASVLLAIGRRGTPRKLGVHGEDLPKVVYRLIDPEQYRGQRVVVVGGGDSALEAAAGVAEAGAASTVLSYRGDAFSRAKAKNRERVERAATGGRLQVMLNSQLRRIEPDTVTLEQQGKLARIANDAVIVNAGGELPDAFLKGIGIAVDTKYGVA